MAQGKTGFPCPECGANANLASSTSSFRTDRLILRGRRCKEGHDFVTMEATISDLHWFDMERIMQLVMKGGAVESSGGGIS